MDVRPNSMDVSETHEALLETVTFISKETVYLLDSVLFITTIKLRVSYSVKTGIYQTRMNWTGSRL